MTSKPDLTVYHDGACPVCQREIALMRRLDSDDRIRFEDVSGDNPLPPDLDRQSALARFHVRNSEGELRNGAAAFVTMWERVPRLRLLAKFARIPGVLSLLELGYRGFLRVRPLLQRLVPPARS